MALYRERTQEQIKRSRRLVFYVVLALVVLVFACAIAFTNIQRDMREQSASSVRAAILNAAGQCCAVEGSYPSSLSYLTQNYHLRVNEQDYAITYEIYAANVPPSVVVIPR